MLLFENFKDIESICDYYSIINYKINSDGSIDVNDNIDLSNYILDKLPLKFNVVTGDFKCKDNQLTSLEGSPKKVNGNFNCSYNQLKTLKGSPIEVYGYFDCSYNQLTTLEGGPKKVSNNYYCYNNQLTNLKGSPKKVYSFGCSNNQLTSLEGSPEEIKYSFYCEYNPIDSIISLFKNFKEFKQLLDDYNYLRGTRIIKARFEQACLDAGIKIPNSIEGYTII